MNKRRIFFRGIMIIAAFFVFFFSGANQAQAIDLSTGTWQQFQVPGASQTFAAGISDSKVVGYYWQGSSAHAFTYDGAAFTTSLLDVPGALSTMPSGVYGDSIIGTFTNGGPSWSWYPYWYDGTTWNTTIFQEYAPTGTAYIYPRGIYENKVVGMYGIPPAGPRGFVFDGTTWVTIDIPGAWSNSLFAIYQNKILGAYADDTGGHVFLDDGTTRSVLNLYNLSLMGLNDDYIVGIEPFNYPYGTFRGYIYDIAAHTTTTLDAPGTCPNGQCTTGFTYPLGISGNKVVGYSGNGQTISGFIYTIPTVLSFLPDYLNGLATTTFNYPDKPLFKAVYTDANGGTNGNVNVVIDGVSHPMTKSLDLINPYYFWSPDDAFVAGTHSYHFETYDGVRLVRMPEMGELGFEVVATGPTILDLNQYKLDGTTPIPVGASTTESAIVLQGVPISPNGDPVQLQVELKLNDAPFAGIPTATSSFVASGAPASVKLTGLLNGHYHWQARAIDTMGNMSSWVEFDPSWTTNFFIIAFNPIPNGFNFSNKSNTSLALSDKKRLAAEVFDLTNVPTTTLNTLLAKKIGENGNCFGMTLWAAKEFGGFTNYLPDRQTVYYNLSEPYSANSRWDASNLSLTSTLAQIIENQIAQYASTTIWRDGELINALLKNNPSDYVLGIYSHRTLSKPRSWFYDTVGHALLPYRIETIDPENEYRVFVYDPNFPGSDDKYVEFIKQNGVWNRKYNMGLLYGTWESASSSETFMYPVSELNFEQSDAQLSSVVIINNAFGLVIQNEAGQRIGYDTSTEYNEISGTTMFFPIGVSDGVTTTPHEVWFRGNLDNALSYRVIPADADSDSEKTSVLKWATAGYIEAEFNKENGDPLLYINSDNTKISVNSTTGRYNLVMNKIINGKSQTVNISSISTSVSSTETYTIDWNVIAAGNDGVTLQIDQGDETIPHIVQIGSDFSDSTAPTTTPILSGTSGQSNWYSSDVSVFLNAADNEDGVGVKHIMYSIDHGTWGAYISTTPVSINTEGTHSVQFYAIDYFGNQEATNTISLAIDKTPPLITVSDVPSTTILGAPVNFSYSATDSLSGIATITATIDGQAISNNAALSNLSPGYHTFQVTTQDNANNVATTQLPFAVIYNFSGFLSPIRSDGSGLYNLGRTLPIKFNLTDVNGTPTTSAVAHLEITNIQIGIIGNTPIDLGISSNDLGALFRISDNQYIYNLDTKILSSGTWQITAILDDGERHSVSTSFR